MVQPNQLRYFARGSHDGCLAIPNLGAPLRAGQAITTVFTFTAQDGKTYTIGRPRAPFSIPFGVPSSPLPRASVSAEANE
jgi:hypothetical protein